MIAADMAGLCSASPARACNKGRFSQPERVGGAVLSSDMALAAVSGRVRHAMPRVPGALHFDVALRVLAKDYWSSS